jgi:hypothetical protein
MKKGGASAGTVHPRKMSNKNAICHWKRRRILSKLGLLICQQIKLDLLSRISLTRRTGRA